MAFSPLSEALAHYSSHLPRYTSYPAANHFQPMTQGAYREALAGLEAGSVSLYVHVPYCSQLCWFCGCHTHITRQYQPVQDYLGHLRKEMALVASAATRRLAVAHLHFGGGSPTLIECEDFRGMMQALREHFNVSDDARIAIEIDPRTVSEAKIAAYAKEGVNRVSFGVQDCDPAVQAAVNRVQPFRTVYEKVMLCRDYGIHDINFDLIYGLPHQTPESITRTIGQVLLLSPSRIALYGYAHVPWKKKNIRLIEEETLPDEHARFALYETASRLLHQAGYVSIGMDHFAREDDTMTRAWRNRALTRNFQGYSVDPSRVLLGLGASAISSVDGGYFQNAANMPEYAGSLQKGHLPTAKGYMLSGDDRIRRDIIGHIMCYLQLDLASVALPDAEKARIMALMKPMEADNLLRLQDGFVSVNPQVPQAARVLASLFDAHFRPAANQHGKVA